VSQRGKRGDRPSDFPYRRGSKSSSNESAAQSRPIRPNAKFAPSNTKLSLTPTDGPSHGNRYCRQSPPACRASIRVCQFSNGRSRDIRMMLRSGNQVFQDRCVSCLRQKCCRSSILANSPRQNFRPQNCRPRWCRSEIRASSQSRTWQQHLRLQKCTCVPQERGQNHAALPLPDSAA